MMELVGTAKKLYDESLTEDFKERKYICHCKHKRHRHLSGGPCKDCHECDKYDQREQIPNPDFKEI